MLLVWLLHLAAPAAGAASVVNGLYVHYYNAGFSSTPITSMPVWSNLTAANVTFQANISGNLGNPQMSSSDTYCGGYIKGQLLTSIAGTYVLQVLAKEGFTLTIDNKTVLNNTGVHLPSVDGLIAGGLRIPWYISDKCAFWYRLYFKRSLHITYSILSLPRRSASVYFLLRHSFAHLASLDKHGNLIAVGWYCNNGGCFLGFDWSTPSSNTMSMCAGGELLNDMCATTLQCLSMCHMDLWRLKEGTCPDGAPFVAI